MLMTALCLLSFQAKTPTPTERGALMAAFGYDTRPDFRRFDFDYNARIDGYKRRLDGLGNELARQAKAGRKTPCSRQLYVEAHWLTYYTADYARIDRMLARLEALLKEPKDPHGEFEQDAEGSYGACHEAWFYKVDRTCDRLVTMQYLDLKPKARLAFLDRVNSPARMRAYLDSVLTSDVAKTGVDNRFELNLTATNLLRLANGHLPSGYAFASGVRPALEKWVRDVWQDPKTGFLGAWYRTPAGLRKTADLSCTFHVVDYTDGKIGHWPEIVRTVLAMRDKEYPYGWMQEGKLSNHHDLDVVTLFRYGWPFMSAAQRKDATAAIRRMMDHCLKETLRSDGSFNMEDMSTVGESFVFPVQFLSEVGFFHREARFWTKEEFPQAHAIAGLIAARIKAMGLDDPESQTALFLVESAD
jgi:hypothetical protein